ncbi:MAG: imidazole glycerol phosphate synthase subunit HisH, partial [Nitrososphaerales archaeon]
MTRIAILDYGVGNLYSLKVALRQLDVQPETTSSMDQIEDYDGLILPGVGNFSRVTQSLGRTRDLLLDWIKDSNPLLGVCLGMQLFFESSEEGPGKGLAFFSGKVRKLPSSVKIPHIGWNLLRTKRQSN